MGQIGGGLGSNLPKTVSIPLGLPQAICLGGGFPSQKQAAPEGMGAVPSPKEVCEKALAPRRR